MIESSSNERAASLANHLVVGHLEHLLPIDGVNIVPLLQASVLRWAVSLKITSLAGNNFIFVQPDLGPPNFFI